MKKRTFIFILWSCVFSGIWLLGLSLIALSAQNSDISTDNVSRYVGNGKWDWTIFIKASDEVLRGISCVEYTLHSTFPVPLQRVCERGSGVYAFGLTMNGWGTFLVPIKIIYKSGTPRYLKHMLVFESKPVDKPLKISVDDTSSSADRNLWEWTVYICGTSEDLDQIKLVQYSLPPLFADAYTEEVHEVFDRASGRRGFALSGIGKEEFDLKIRVFYNSGRYQDLRHHVKF